MPHVARCSPGQLQSPGLFARKLLRNTVCPAGSHPSPGSERRSPDRPASYPVSPSGRSGERCSDWFRFAKLEIVLPNSAPEPERPDNDEAGALTRFPDAAPVVAAVRGFKSPAALGEKSRPFRYGGNPGAWAFTSLLKFFPGRSAWFQPVVLAIGFWIGGGGGPAFAQRPLGTDVSGYQPVVSWMFAKNHGVAFGWAKATEGTGYVNPGKVEQITGARAVGIHIGSTISRARAVIPISPGRTAPNPRRNFSGALPVITSRLAAST